MSDPDESDRRENDWEFEQHIASLKSEIQNIINKNMWCKLHYGEDAVYKFMPIRLEVDSSAGWDMDIVTGILLDEEGTVEGWKGFPLFLIQQVVVDISGGMEAGSDPD